MEDIKDLKNDLSARLASYIIQLMAGDTYMIDDIYALLKQVGYVDEDGFYIEEEE